MAQKFPSSPLSGRSTRLTVDTLLWLLLGAAEAGPAKATAARAAVPSPVSATRRMVRIMLGTAFLLAWSSAGVRTSTARPRRPG